MADVNYIDWHVHPFRADRWFELWLPALDRALAFGASSCELTRDSEDPLHFRQTSVWEDRADFERYWYSPEIVDYRVQATGLFQVPIQPVWYTVEGTGEIVPEELEAEA